jgi:hypothetical protein
VRGRDTRQDRGLACFHFAWAEALDVEWKADLQPSLLMSLSTDMAGSR